MNEQISLILFLVGVIFSITGILLLIWPPKNVNSIYGYKTARSKKSNATWKYSNQFFAKLLTGIGIGNIIIGVSLSFLGCTLKISFIPIIILIASSAFIIIIITEQYVKIYFDDNGNFKS